ncbi:hypothetical protein VTO42DRAFT_4454 [Malbranchea cinnamomea]
MKKFLFAREDVKILFRLDTGLFGDEPWYIVHKYRVCDLHKVTSTYASNPANEPVLLRRSNRIPKPSRALLESQATERLFNSRNERRRSEREQQDRDNGESAQRVCDRGGSNPDADELSDSANRVDNNCLTFKNGIKIPQSYNEAVNVPKHGAKWREAIHTELRTLISFGTWRPDGHVERFKACLVARGFTQEPGKDFDETFSPVMRLESLRVLFSLAAAYCLISHIMDATNAYVGSEIDRPILMTPPEGIEHPAGQVCELRRSLYGLKQSGRLWHQKISKYIISLGFKPTSTDPSVFINSRGIIIALYVDNILIFGRNTDLITLVKEKLASFHPMKDSGLVTKILGIHVSWLPDRITLDQEHYCRKILTEFGMEECKTAATPISSSTNLLGTESPVLSKQLHSVFQRMIGRLIFLTTATHLDLQYAVNSLSQHLANPQKVHYKAAKHVLRYLQDTASYRLSYSRSPRPKLFGYVDSSYVNAQDLRSTGGHLFYIGDKNSPVSWSSRRQPWVAESTTEAEYIAMADAAKQGIWLRHLLYTLDKKEVYKDTGTPLLEDNKGALHLVENPAFHSWSKHFYVRLHVLRQYRDHNEILPTYCPTSEQLADGMTKALDKVLFGKFVAGLRLQA